MMRDAQSAARVANKKVDSLHAQLSAVEESRDRLDDDLKQTCQLLRERTESLMQYFDQSVAVEVSTSVTVTVYYLVAFLARGTARSIIGCWHGNVVCLSLHLSVMVCMAYILHKSV